MEMWSHFAESLEVLHAIPVADIQPKCQPIVTKQSDDHEFMNQLWINPMKPHFCWLN